jgi:hypothetical protein
LALMGRFPTWIIVGAVVILVAVAAADALRPGPPEAERKAERPIPDELNGVLVAARADCSARGVSLPESREQPLRRPVDCDGAVWSSDHTLNASCSREFTTVASLDSGQLLRLRGCSPSWRPDGAVSVVHDGDLVIARRRGRPFVFLSRAELAADLTGEVPGGRAYELQEVAWHGTDAFAGIVAGPKPSQRAVVYYAPDGVTSVIPERGQRISGVRVSPLGNIAFARSQAGREYVMVDPAGNEIPLPRIRNARAIAWSDDERWVALATRTATFIARTGTRRVVMRLALGGETLEWLE